MSYQPDLNTRGKANTIKGRISQFFGRLERKTGKAVGNRKMETKGAMREMGGKAQAAGGEIQQKADQALRSSENYPPNPNKPSTGPDQY